jgi:hypothetical protein
LQPCRFPVYDERERASVWTQRRCATKRRFPLCPAENDKKRYPSGNLSDCSTRWTGIALLQIPCHDSRQLNDRERDPDPELPL